MDYLKAYDCDLADIQAFKAVFNFVFWRGEVELL